MMMMMMMMMKPWDDVTHTHIDDDGSKIHHHGVETTDETPFLWGVFYLKLLSHDFDGSIG